MRKRHIMYALSAATVTATCLGAAPPTDMKVRHVVRAGDSIQEAVDSARAGDTVVVSPGTYRESVRIDTSGVTLRGAGPRTEIVPDGNRADSACAQSGNGICVTGTAGEPVENVTIRSLTVAGFKKNGVWATGTDRLTVRGVTSRKNGQWGIAQEKSVRGTFQNNKAIDNGDAGIFLANTVNEEGGALDTRGAAIEDNLLTGNRIGITVRRVRNLTVDDNELTGNCAGVFIVGDESRPRAGAMKVRGNEVIENNKHCPGSSRLPFIQGSGIVLTGAEETLVQGNYIRNNVGTSPMSGGIVLFRSFVGTQNERNVISDNLLLLNKPADLANRDTGTGNRFIRNMCRSSEPANLC
ncbi:right-handed parallel beta-helix repeat-containing protein [Streptomyces sp. Pv4-95]|uniref:right-handed parallel beta-helix repeat-containing protein n=1 Tax=Streptomyces sp. Pv4-95 TaxID=3049543 RepID=UPI003892119D